ncbi:MAG: hypothetical protein JWM86_1937 [Thermoleophilia bacterium]|nr:hypothetical protein [Thermoleophilia bacterium]
MAFDLFASAKTTAIAALVSASFASPIVAKSDVVSSAFGGSGPRAEQVVAGGVAFSMPKAWGRLGSSATTHDGDAAAEGDRIGTVVSGLCPGGSAGATCRDGVQLTFITYSGAKQHELPLLSKLERQLDTQLADKYAVFEKLEAKQRPGLDGIRYLDYAFTYHVGTAVRHERIAAFRHSDGSGVIALSTGAELGAHDAAISRFLEGGHAAVDGER